MTDSRFAVLAVCTANICRSPMMEMLLRDQLDPERFEIASAGVNGMVGHPMDAMSEMELMRHGLSSGDFRSQPITRYLLGAADLTLTATARHRKRILEDEPRAMRTTFTLLEFVASCDLVDDDDLTASQLVAAAATLRQGLKGSMDVQDPYRRAPKVHRETADQIADAVGRVSARLNRCPA